LAGWADVALGNLHDRTDNEDTALRESAVADDLRPELVALLARFRGRVELLAHEFSIIEATS
jgi:hypothetical protein